MVEVDIQNQKIPDEYYCAEEIQTIDNMEDCMNYYGQNDFILNDKDIEDLKNGKIINASIQGEYSMTLRYRKEISNGCK